MDTEGLIELPKQLKGHGENNNSTGKPSFINATVGKASLTSFLPVFEL